MAKLRAFVGHSFNPEDQDVVREFTDYFDSLHGGMSFEYHHATEARPKALSAKVRELMEGKNVFIGIFTKKEYRVTPEKLKRSFIKKRHYLSDDNLKWAGSEWIIQESGYALGKGMTPLFLVESGIENLAGLQGDLEYIPFNRDKPSASFKKINEMLRGLLKEEEHQIRPPATESPPEPTSDETTCKDEVRKPETKGDKVVKAYATLYNLVKIEENFKDAEKQLPSIIEECSDDNFDETWWKCTLYKWIAEQGETEGFTRLEQISEQNPKRDFPDKCLAHLLEGYKNYPKAAMKYLSAAEKTNTAKAKVFLVSKAAEMYAVTGEFPKAYETIMKVASLAEDDPVVRAEIFNALSKVARKEEDDNLFFSFAEKVLDDSPTDKESRFSLAYRYSECGNEPFALYHYKLLCEHTPDGANWNNIGVTYLALGMKAKSISSYKKAGDKYGNTLAMANIGSKYIDAGFLDEAKQTLEKARGQANFHDNVDKTLAAIKPMKETESNLEEKTLKGIETEKSFRLRFAEAYISNAEVNIDGEWNTKHGKILLSVEDGSALGRGTFKRKLFALRSVIAGATIPPPETETTLTLTGTIRNRTVQYSLTVMVSGGLLTSSEATYNGMMHISLDSKTVCVMEKSKDKAWEFYDMTRTL